MLDDTNDSRSRLPLRGSSNPARRKILASHLIFTGYAHWFPNDLRGSGSEQIRKEDIKPLGPILLGRQFPQPSRDKVKRFFRDAEPRIEHERVWFREEHREVIAHAFGESAARRGYTLWACAVCSNHAHVVVRTHRDRSEIVWGNLARASCAALQQSERIPPNHPVWSHRCYKVFLYSDEDVRSRIRYVAENPGKEGLPPQRWSFVAPCPALPGVIS